MPSADESTCGSWMVGSNASTSNETCFPVDLEHELRVLGLADEDPSSDLPDDAGHRNFRQHVSLSVVGGLGARLVSTVSEAAAKIRRPIRHDDKRSSVETTHGLSMVEEPRSSSWSAGVTFLHSYKLYSGQPGYSVRSSDPGIANVRRQPPSNSPTTTFGNILQQPTMHGGEGLDVDVSPSSWSAGVTFLDSYRASSTVRRFSHAGERPRQTPRSGQRSRQTTGGEHCQATVALASPTKILSTSSSRTPSGRPKFFSSLRDYNREGTREVHSAAEVSTWCPDLTASKEDHLSDESIEGIPTMRAAESGVSEANIVSEPSASRQILPGAVQKAQSPSSTRSGGGVVSRLSRPAVRRQQWHMCSHEETELKQSDKLKKEPTTFFPTLETAGTLGAALPRDGRPDRSCKTFAPAPGNIDTFRPSTWCTPPLCGRGSMPTLMLHSSDLLISNAKLVPP